MKHRLNPISSAWFSYNQTTRTFSTEASSLRPANFLARLYDDVMDVGFMMKSRVTGNEVTYVMEAEHREPATDEIGDITHWTFTPTNESCDKHRECVNTKVVIFND
jgi:hypothetical protein